jgi:CzcA family heavy metal efflux pump
MRPRPSAIRAIVSTSLRLRYLVIVGAAAMMVFGIATLHDQRVDVFPEFAPPRIVIQTASLGLSTSDVEELVTVPLEQALRGVPNVTTLRSKSVPQLSSIEMLFDPSTDLLKDRELVQERLATVAPSLPTWAAPPVMLAPVSATGRAMEIGMTSTKQSLIEMSMDAYWNIRARLLRVPGVANVAIWNERLQMMTVQVDPKRMAAKGATLETVMEATAGAVDSGLLKFSTGAVIGTGGTIETPNQRLSVRNVLPVVTPSDMAKIPVDGAHRAGVRIGDVASVKYANQPLFGDAVINGKPGLLLVVEKLPWADTQALTAGVEAAIHELQPGLPDVAFDTHVFRQSDFIQLSIDNLTQALVLGFLLVVAIVALFLFEWRAALISLVTIPLSLLATLLVLHWRGATINTMTLAGLVIALGAVVDDAIIDVENIVRRLREERASSGNRSAARVILEASLEVRGPIIYATLIIVAASVPVLLLDGLTGAFFRPLALSYTLAIVASLLVALTLTPALTLLLLRGRALRRGSSPVVRWLHRRYTSLLSGIIVRPRAVYATFGVVTIAGLLVVPQLGQSLFPAFKERDLLVHWVSLPGTSDAEMVRSTEAVSADIKAVPGVRSIGAHIGQALLGEEVAGVNLGEIWVSLDPSVDYEKTVDAVKDAANRYPGLFREVQTYLDERIEEVLTGGKEALIVRVYGEDVKTLRKQAQQVLATMKTVEGVSNAHPDVSTDVPQLQVKVDLAKAERVGLKPGDVRRAAATLVAGEEVGDLFRAGRAYDVVVWSTPSTRTDLGAVRALPIDTPSGHPVRLGDVAAVELAPNPNAIEREGDSRYLDVSAEFSGADIGTTVGQLQQRLDAMTFERGYHAQILGQFAERQAAQTRLLLVAIGAGIAVLLLLQAAFGTWRHALIVFVTLPMALVGGILAARLTGGVISLGSLVGFFTVFGIAARNGILLVNHAQHLEQEEGETWGAFLVLRAARERLAPILMTSLATGLALVPLVVLGDRPGHEIEHPLAVVILGGLATSTLLSLFVLPSLLLRFGRPSNPPSPPPDEWPAGVVPNQRTLGGVS